ncbi:MAG: ATP-binding protein [Blastocatellia bacterium]|nr:ATP-binding protein [Blastocatellia bacterium]MCS7156765.1 ATP-binding protein [Blastocatellia bacterium]MCX7752723.1 ATP-binding protein [Blastocatellia bacterium]MDW8167455.1 ATP-binding protein [Acidobacteriota bacterium]MDW8256802.1 ATP-binding protein [Acidobacteriota bacterium]
MKGIQPGRFRRSAIHWLFGTMALAGLTFVCFRFQVNPTTVALLYLIVIVLVSLRSSFIPSAFVSIIAYLCLDSFFTAPLFRPAMNQPLDVIAPLAFLSTSFVITRLMSKVHKSFQEIQDLKDQLRLLIDTIPGLVWSSLPDGSVEFLNQRWLDYTGLSPEPGLDWVERVVHPDDRARFADEWGAALATGNPLETETRLRRADGEYRWLLVRAVPLRDKNGKVLKWYGIGTDIEDRKRAEEALRKSQSELAYVTRVMTMGALAASIAHEINQPLAAIVTNASACLRWLAADPPNLTEASEAARRIIRDGNRASEVIRGIRAFLRKSETVKTRLDINQLIQEVAHMTRSEAERIGATIRLELAADLPLVWGDRVQLQQVILNLVINGIESLAAVTERPRQVYISSGLYESDKVLVTVQDSGIGIPQEELEKIFDAFYTTKPQGLGMGLAISRSIVEDHGGRLWAVPNDGPGATFQFTLPKHE